MTLYVKRMSQIYASSGIRPSPTIVHWWFFEGGTQHFPTSTSGVRQLDTIVAFTKCVRGEKIKTQIGFKTWLLNLEKKITL